MYAIRSYYAPEFRNRLDAVVRFNHLSAEVMESIVRKELHAVRDRLSEKGVSLATTPEAVALIARLGYSPEFGARNVARLVEDLIT